MHQTEDRFDDVYSFVQYIFVDQHVRTDVCMKQSGVSMKWECVQLRKTV